MTRELAIEILRRHRPGVDDASSPEVVEALEWVARDPQLAQWHRSQLILQARIQSHLRSVAVPASLRERLVAAEQARRRESRIIPLRWGGAIAAAAACLVLGFALWWRLPAGAEPFNAYRERMVRTALREYRMEMVTGDLGRIHEFLRQKGGPSDWTLSPGLAQVPAIGCAGLRWQDHPVSLICFNSSRGGTLYLFVARATEVPGAPKPEAPHEFRSINRMSTVAWSSGTNTFLLATRDSNEDLRLLIR